MSKHFLSPLIFFIAFLLYSANAEAQEKELPGELKPFLPKGYELLDFVEGDLNADQKKDAILILKAPGEDTAMDMDLKRPFLLLSRQADGKLKLEKRNDNLVMCKSCGGVFGDPYESVTIGKKGFSISFYGGSNWRWGYDYTFTYNAEKKNWFLTREQQTHYNSSDPDTGKESDIEETELGIIPIEKFNVDPPHNESKWKVTAVKSYFYDSPKMGSKPRKGYLIKGDQVTAIRELTNFVEVSFQNKKEEFSSGYVLKSSLQKIK